MRLILPPKAGQTISGPSAHLSFYSWNGWLPRRSRRRDENFLNPPKVSNSRSVKIIVGELYARNSLMILTERLKIVPEHRKFDFRRQAADQSKATKSPGGD